MWTANDIVRVAKWASIECTKQRSGERSVGHMVEGWRYALTMNEPPGSKQIIHLGYLVDPGYNLEGKYRQVNVMVGMSKKASWEQVPRLMHELVGAWHRLTSDEWYREFEEIHPFRDGNGRTGNILWNLHRMTLEPQELDFPPDFWGDERLSFGR